MNSINPVVNSLAQRSLLGATDRPAPGVAAKGNAPETTAPVAVASSKDTTEPSNEVGNALPPRRDDRVSAEEEANIAKSVERLNDQAASLNRSIKFSVDKETGRTVIKVLDRATDEVIRQIPPEYTMEILRRMDIGAGLLLEEKA